MFVLILLGWSGSAAIRVGGYPTKEACEAQKLIAVATIRQDRGTNWTDGWTAVCLRIVVVTP
jgi:hypothetical protein